MLLGLQASPGSRVRQGSYDVGGGHGCHHIPGAVSRTKQVLRWQPVVETEAIRSPGRLGEEEEEKQAEATFDWKSSSALKPGRESARDGLCYCGWSSRTATSLRHRLHHTALAFPN